MSDKRAYDAAVQSQSEEGGDHQEYHSHYKVGCFACAGNLMGNTFLFYNFLKIQLLFLFFIIYNFHFGDGDL